jgi:hypothetical protein
MTVAVEPDLGWNGGKGRRLALRAGHQRHLWNNNSNTMQDQQLGRKSTLIGSVQIFKGYCAKLHTLVTLRKMTLTRSNFSFIKSIGHLSRFMRELLTSSKSQKPCLGHAAQAGCELAGIFLRALR